MQRRQRDLRGADQVQVVVGQPVDLLLGVGQEAGSVQRALADQHRRDDRLEPLAPQLLERESDERELEHHQVAAQVREPRPGQPRPALHVDPVAGELEVVLAGGAGFPDLVQDRVLVGGVLGGQVRQRREHAVALGAHRVLLVAQLPAARGERGELLALLGRRRALAALARAVLLGAQLLELGRDRAPAPIELEQPVDRGRRRLAAAASAARTASGSRRISWMSSMRGRARAVARGTPGWSQCCSR